MRLRVRYGLILGAAQSCYVIVMAFPLILACHIAQNNTIGSTLLSGLPTLSGMGLLYWLLFKACRKDAVRSRPTILAGTILVGDALFSSLIMGLWGDLFKIGGELMWFISPMVFMILHDVHEKLGGEDIEDDDAEGDTEVNRSLVYTRSELTNSKHIPDIEATASKVRFFR